MRESRTKITISAHAPKHILVEQGTYMVTGGTYFKQHFFNSRPKLDLLRDALLELSETYRWNLEAWCVFSNHYHFVGVPSDGTNLARFVGHLHSRTATAVNKLDGEPGRKVWYQYWDTILDDERALFTRMAYVLENPVRHGLVTDARMYEWCSARRFVAETPLPRQKTVQSFRVDSVSVRDDYDPLLPS